MSYGTKKFPVLLVLSFVLVLAATLAYLYFQSQNKVLSDQAVSLDRQIAEIKTQLDELNTNTSVSAQKGTNLLNTIKENEVPWSSIIKDVYDKLIPQDLIAKQAAVVFSSYTASEGGKLTFNGHTNPSTDIKKQLKAVSDTIRSFNSSPSFTNAYVPSISKSSTTENETILSFIFNVEYKGTAAQTAAEEAASSVQRK
jgi:Tfp pilus assembly protein PilN